MGKDKQKRHREDTAPQPSPARSTDPRGSDLYHPSPVYEDLQEPGEGHRPRLDRRLYEQELARLQVELVKMQYWIKQVGTRLTTRRPCEKMPLPDALRGLGQAQQQAPEDKELQTGR